MVDQLATFADEVTRVAREVGTEGRLGGQAQVRGVSGVWKGLTENVNTLAGNLTSQVRNIAEVTTAVANGDLSKKITVDVSGEVLELKETINTMVDQLRSFAAEVTRVAREVGTEGQLGGQAEVEDVSGVWRDLTESVNSMAVEPHLAGAQHRRGDDRGRAGRPRQEDHRRRQGRDPRAEGHDQHDGRPARHVRRRGHARRARGRHRGPARRPGAGRGRQRRLARPDRERERHGGLVRVAGARDRRRVDGRHAGRPHAVGHPRRARRGLGPQGQHQPDDLDPPRDDAAERGAGLAELEPRAVRRPDAGAARPAGGLAADHERADAARRGAPRRVLRRRGDRRRRRRSASSRRTATRSARRSRTASSSARRSSGRRRSRSSRS